MKKIILAFIFVLVSITGYSQKTGSSYKIIAGSNGFEDVFRPIDGGYMAILDSQCEKNIYLYDNDYNLIMGYVFLEYMNKQQPPFFAKYMQIYEPNDIVIISIYNEDGYTMFKLDYPKGNSKILKTKFDKVFQL